MLREMVIKISEIAGKIIGSFLSERSLALFIFAGHFEAALAYSVVRAIMPITTWKPKKYFSNQKG